MVAHTRLPEAQEGGAEAAFEAGAAVRVLKGPFKGLAGVDQDEAKARGNAYMLKRFPELSKWTKTEVVNGGA